MTCNVIRAGAFVAAGFWLGGTPLGAQEAPDGNASVPTFSRDVAPIFYAKCISCHRPGEVAPMSLITFREARPWARAIHE